MGIKCLEPEMIEVIVSVVENDLDGADYILYEDFNRVFMHTEQAETELMLRIRKSATTKKVTFARVSFEKKRQGSMTKLVNAFVENGYSVSIECALTEDIKLFMEKGPFEWKNASVSLFYVGDDYDLVAKKL